MQIGEPRRVYTVEPLDDPVPRELPRDPEEEEEPLETPDDPATVPA